MFLKCGWCFCKIGFKIIDIHMDVDAQCCRKICCRYVSMLAIRWALTIVINVIMGPL